MILVLKVIGIHLPSVGIEMVEMSHGEGMIWNGMEWNGTGQHKDNRIVRGTHNTIMHSDFVIELCIMHAIHISLILPYVQQFALSTYISNPSRWNIN